MSIELENTLNEINDCLFMRIQPQLYLYISKKNVLQLKGSKKETKSFSINISYLMQINDILKVL